MQNSFELTFVWESTSARSSIFGISILQGQVPSDRYDVDVLGLMRLPSSGRSLVYCSVISRYASVDSKLAESPDLFTSLQPPLVVVLWVDYSEVEKIVQMPAVQVRMDMKVPSMLTWFV